MSTDVYEIERGIKDCEKQIRRIANLIEGDPFPENTYLALEGIRKELHLQNQLKMLELANLLILAPNNTSEGILSVLEALATGLNYIDLRKGSESE